MPTTPDILLKNGIFWTGNPRTAYAGHVASTGGRIAGIGPEKAVSESGKATIDLRGRFAMPGFIDAHTHFRIGGASLNRLDLRSARTQTDLSTAVRKRAKAHPDGRWLVGGNWDHESWQEKRLPTRDLIDDFTGSFPVFLDRVDTHMALVNSAALQLAGITRETPDPPGGVIVRDERGEPTGIVKDAAREMVLRLIPEPPLEELMRDAREAMGLANRLGVTSVNDIGPERDLRAYVELEKSGGLSVRIDMILPIQDYGTLVGRGVRADAPSGKSEWIGLGTVKAFADGSLGAGTAWFYEPYKDDGANSGLATEILSTGRLEEYALDADRNHIQLAIHAIGDRAVGSVLDIFEKVKRENPHWDRRFRIEHAQHLSDDDFARFSNLDVIASVQPYHCADDGRWATKKIGDNRARNSFAFRRFLDKGVRLAFGTDWPVAPLDPMKGICAAVTRATIDGANPGGWIPEQRIGVGDALRAYTYWSAYASFSERDKGILETGKLSDIVVLSANPFEVPPEELGNINVVLTIVGGKVVYTDGTLYNGNVDAG